MMNVDKRFKREVENTERWLPDIRKGEAIAIVWHGDDVRSLAEENDVELTDAEVSEVLYNLKRRHDAGIGVNWDNIEFWIDSVVEERT